MRKTQRFGGAIFPHTITLVLLNFYIMSKEKVELDIIVYKKSRILRL